MSRIPTSSFLTKLTQDKRQCIKIFIEFNSCLSFIQTVFLIVSGSFGSQVVPLIYVCEHIHQIFLFCGSIAAHTNWAIDYTDKMLMFDHEDDLLRRLFKESEEYLRQQAQLYIEQAKVCKDRAEVFKQESCG